MKQFLTLLIAFVVCSSFAQEKKEWSLEACVNHALENNISVLQSKNNILSSEQDIVATKGNYYPTFGARLSQGLSLGNTEVFQGQFVDRTAHSTNVGLSLNQTLYNGNRINNQYKQAKLSKETSELQLGKTKDDISLFVVNSYLNVMFNQENMEIAKAQLEFSKQQLKQVQDLVEAGVQPQANIYDAEASLAADEQNLTTAENNFELSLLSLSQLLQLPFDGFTVETVDLDAPSQALLYNEVDQVLEYALTNRYEIKIAEKNIENSQLNTEISKSGYYPNVSLGYGFGSNAFYTNLSDTEESFFNQLNNQKSHSFNLSVNIPIFSRFQNKTNVAKSKINEEQNKLNFEQAKLDIESNVQRAFTDAKAAFKAYVAANKSLESQELAFNNSQERYNMGAMNAFDLEQSRFRLINAQSSLVNAKYDFVFKTKVLDFYLGKQITLN